MVEKDYFDPFIGELVPDDGFAFTLLSCHCSGNTADHGIYRCSLFGDKGLSIKGEKLALRKPEAGDLEFLMQMWNNGKVMNSFGYPEGIKATKEYMQKWFETVSSEDYQKRNAIFIVVGESGKSIGECGVYELNISHLSAELDVKIGAEELSGKGVEVEVVKVLTDYIFGNTPLESLTSEVEASDDARKKALESNGYKFTGWDREYYSTTIKGRRQLKVYEILNEKLYEKRAKE